MSRLSTIRKDIFDETSQWLKGINPKRIRPIYDRCLIQDQPEDDSRRGSLWIPESCRDLTQIRCGLVISAGLGDKYSEHGIDPRTREVRRKPLEKRLPMSVEAGDRVLYNRRREAEFFINGNRYSLIHEEQSCFALLRGESVLPLGERIIVRRDASIRNRQGVLYLPDSSVEKNQEGIVISLGPGRYSRKGERIPIDLKVGDRVLFGKKAGSDVKIQGKEHLIMSEKDVLAVLG